jgi:glycerol dehydrogenase-like iron-containing ADH family enzyme
MPHDPSPPEFRAVPRVVESTGATRQIAAAMRATGLADPVLVVAADGDIASLAPAWADAFAEAAWTHRVFGFGGGSSPREIAAIAAEAASLGATAIVGVGDAIEAAAAAAAAGGCRFVACPTGGPIPRCSPDLVVVDTAAVENASRPRIDS